MSNSTDAINEQIRHGLDQLATLRDEIRVRVHLAGLEAKDAWSKLEPQVGNVEALAKDATEASKKAIDDMIHKFKSFQDSIKTH